VTELLQPLAAAPALPTVADEVASERAPSFAELVYAHFAWWHELHKHGPMRPDATYQRLLDRFERCHGTLLHAFWCSHVECAVALTIQRRRFWWQRTRWAFHRESDWATRDLPEIASQLHRCDNLALRAQTVLTGVRQRICLQLVTSAAAHLLSLVDIAASSASEAEVERGLARERSSLDKVETYYRQAANGQAQIAYFAGMAVVAATIGLTAGLFLSIEWASGVASLVAGSVGAVVSVVQRINDGDFELSYDVGRPYASFLGGLRPIIGGALALAVSFAFSSGIAHLPVSGSDPSADHRLALVVVSFLAGFSERWAQDTLGAVQPASRAGARATEPAASDAAPDP
jgi:hypothetical protein